MSIITLNTRSLPDSAVTTAKINADAVTDAKIADDVIGTEHLTAGEVDATALGADSVTAAKINDDIISGTTALTSAPADTDEFLVSDAGTLKRIDYSLIKGGGQFNLVTRTAITSDASNVNFTNLEANTYHKFVLQGIDSTDNNGEDISARVSTDNGSSFINSNYQYAYYQFYSSGSTNTTGSGSGSTTADKWRFGDGFHTSGSDEGLHGEFILYNVGNGQRPFFMSQTVHKADTTNRLRATVAGGTNTSGLTVNGVQFFFDSGNITGSSYAFITHYKGVIA
jgi:hypothetical protein